MATHLTEGETSGDCVIDVEDKECLQSLKEELSKASKKQSRAEPRTIFRVPEHLRRSNPAAYEPEVISFGPYHRGKRQLQEMEDLKMRYLLKLLQRNPQADLEDYYGEVKKLEIRARSSYSHDDKALSSDEFVKMLLLDGCFIVHLLLMLHGKDEKRGVEDDDPIQRGVCSW